MMTTSAQPDPSERMRALVFVVVDGSPDDVLACASAMADAVEWSTAVPVAVNWTPEVGCVAENAPDGPVPVAVDLHEIAGLTVEHQLGHAPA